MKRSFVGWSIAPMVCFLLVFGPGHLNAQPVQTWSAPVSFSLKVTAVEDDGSGDVKVVNETFNFTGTMSIYVGLDGPVQSNGCYVRFAGQDGTTICIRSMVAITSDIGKSTNEKVYVVGTGDFSTYVDGVPATGICYLDAKGSLKEDSTGDFPVSLSLSGKLGGGFGAGADDGGFVFSGSFKATMATPLAP